MHFSFFSPLAVALYAQFSALLAVPLTSIDQCTLEASCYVQCITQTLPYSMTAQACKIGIVCPLADLNHLPPNCFPRLKDSKESEYEAVCEPSADCQYETKPVESDSTDISENKCRVASPTPTAATTPIYNSDVAEIASFIASIESAGDLPFTGAEVSGLAEDTEDDGLFVTYPMPSGCYRRCLKCERSTGDEEEAACVSRICQDVCPNK